MSKYVVAVVVGLAPDTYENPYLFLLPYKSFVTKKEAVEYVPVLIPAVAGRDVCVVRERAGGVYDKCYNSLNVDVALRMGRYEVVSGWAEYERHKKNWEST